MTTKPVLKNVVLTTGSHGSREDGVCVMELAAWLAGRAHTDRPPCVDPAIAAFLMAWNDSLDDETRQKLKPYAKKVLNTATNATDTKTRGWMATDWLVREFTPAWLRLAGLTEHAETLERLAPLVSGDTARKAQPSIDAARSAARSAAYSTADEALAPTVKILQKSAFNLLDRMIAVGKATS